MEGRSCGILITPLAQGFVSLDNLKASNRYKWLSSQGKGPSAHHITICVYPRKIVGGTLFQYLYPSSNWRQQYLCLVAKMIFTGSIRSVLYAAEGSG